MQTKIQEILDLITPIWIKSGWFEDEDLKTLESLGFKDIKDGFYDGKIIHFTNKGVTCDFLKESSSYSFYFKNGFYVTVYEEFEYAGSDEVFSTCSYEESFTNITNTYIDPFTLTTCYDVNCKIVVGQLLQTSKDINHDN